MRRTGKTGHHVAPRRRRVLVIMKDGDHFLAKFKEKRAHTIEFMDHAPVQRADVATLAIYRDPAGHQSK